MNLVDNDGNYNEPNEDGTEGSENGKKKPAGPWKISDNQNETSKFKLCYMMS